MLPRPGGAPAGGFANDGRRQDEALQGGQQAPRAPMAPSVDYGQGGGYAPQPQAYAARPAGQPADFGPGSPPAPGMTSYGGQGGGHSGPGAASGATDWNHWAPAGINEQMLNAGGAMARNLLASNMSRYQPGVWGFWRALKYYFAVDNAYVLRKLQTLLLPVARRDWVRREAGGGGDADDDGKETRYLRPCLDPNAPDLYIPLMAFITYVLTTGFVKGASGTFTPEALTEATSSCVVTALLELLVFRLGLYLLGAPAATLDLLAYTGYKYVPLVTNMAAGIAFGWTGYYVAFAWTASMSAYFMLKTMADAVPAGGGSTRDFTIFGLAALQALVIWWLGYTRDLGARDAAL